MGPRGAGPAQGAGLVPVRWPPPLIGAAQGRRKRGRCALPWARWRRQRRHRGRDSLSSRGWSPSYGRPWRLRAGRGWRRRWARYAPLWRQRAAQPPLRSGSGCCWAPSCAGWPGHLARRGPRACGSGVSWRAHPALSSASCWRPLALRGQSGSRGRRAGIPRAGLGAQQGYLGVQFSWAEVRRGTEISVSAGNPSPALCAFRPHAMLCILQTQSCISPDC